MIIHPRIKINKKLIMMENSFKVANLNHRFVSYDTLREKRKNLKSQQPTHFNDKFLPYSLEETAVNILKDVSC